MITNFYPTRFLTDSYFKKISKAIEAMLMRRQAIKHPNELEIFIEDYDFKYPNEGYIEVLYRTKDLVYVLYTIDKRELAGMCPGC